MDTVSDDGMLEDVPLWEEDTEEPTANSEPKQSKLLSILTPVSTPFSFRNRKRAVECELNASDQQHGDLSVNDLFPLEDDIGKDKRSHEDSERSGITLGSDSSDSDREEEKSPRNARKARIAFFRPKLPFRLSLETFDSSSSSNNDGNESSRRVIEEVRERNRKRFVVNLTTMSMGYPRWQLEPKATKKLALEEISFASDGSLHGEEAEIIDLSSGGRGSEKSIMQQSISEAPSQVSLSTIEGPSQASLSYLTMLS